MTAKAIRRMRRKLELPAETRDNHLGCEICQRQQTGPVMLKWLVFVAALTATSPAPAQDIAGLEDCSQARGPDKKIGCLQSNVEFLHKLIRTNDASAQAKLSAATVKISELQSYVERLRAALEQLEKKIPSTPNPSASPTPKP